MLGQFARCRGPLWEVDDFSQCFQHEYVVLCAFSDAQTDFRLQLSPDPLSSDIMRVVPLLPDTSASQPLNKVKICPSIPSVE